jgi:hypothetical protein
MMRTQVREKMMIKAPAAGVWHVLAHEFDKLGSPLFDQTENTRIMPQQA